MDVAALLPAARACCSSGSVIWDLRRLHPEHLNQLEGNTNERVRQFRVVRDR
jgi:hypothetical protein